MSRRFALASLAAATVAGALLTAPASSAPATELPRLDCKQRFVDPQGDAFRFKDPNTGTGAANYGAIDSADLTGVFLRLTADEFQAFLRFKDLKPAADMPATDTVYKYEFYAKLTDKKTLFMSAYLVNPKEPWGALKPTGTTAAANTGGLPADQIPEFAHEFRDKEDLLILTVSRARLEQNIGVPLAPGHIVTGISAKTTQRTHTEAAPIDDLLKNPPGPWDVADDSCFGAAPATLADLVAPATVQFSDTATLKAKLMNEKGEALAGKPVAFTVGDAAPVTVTTGADGVATAVYRAQLAAGDYPVVASFEGDTADGKSRIDGGTLKVVTEPTAFGALAVTKPTATTRTVTATLLDNDKAPVVGQPVVWYVNGKKVATVNTDSKGKSVLRTAKPTQTVQATYAGLADKYAKATPKSVKV